MSIALAVLVPSLKREVSPPGIDLLPAATDAEYEGNLSDAFWETVLDGIVKAYTEDAGSVTPLSGTTDFPREMQQLVVFYAGVRIVRNHLRAMTTKTSAKAGPVEFEQEHSATLLNNLLTELQDRRSVLLRRLSDLGYVPSYVIDGVQSRTDSYIYGDTSFPSSGGHGGSRSYDRIL